MAAQGLSFNLKLIAHDSDRYGYLSQNSLPIPPERLQLRLGLAPELYNALLCELLETGAWAQDNNRTLFNPVMVEDAKEREKDAKRKRKARRK